MENTSLLSGAPPQIKQLDMEHDFSIWGILAMPVGVLLCFGPALVVWLKIELKGEPPEEPPAKQRDISAH